MKETDMHADVLDVRISRRQLLVDTAATGTALLLGGSRVFAAAADEEIRVGFISPQSGPLGQFGQSDPYVIDLARKALAQGIEVGGRRYRVTILNRDSQSSPSRASQLANELITKHKVHLMLATSSPEVVNPVADACEAAGVPSLGTSCPLESFFFGRGGKVGEPSPFKWTFCFSFDVAQFVAMYLSAWNELPTNRKVAALYPNDADGNAYREHVAPALEKGGYKIIDPGAYEDGTTDYSSQIALFNRENCQVFNCVSLTPDFNTFWRQAAQLRYLDKVRVAQLSKTGEFPSQIQQLGVLGYGLLIGAYWAPVFPWKSPLTGQSSQQMTDAYEKAMNRQWNQQFGASLSLLEVGAAVLKAAKDPTSRSAIRDVIPTLDMITTAGPVNFKVGPYPNTTPTVIVGAQWVKAPAGSRYPQDLVTIGNKGAPAVPVQRKLAPFRV
ncbi:MAG TPA: ABC transporter substrate-binding protein [Nevskiaceae bacterium]